jgi:F0F1-type ATP synthase epsilon subunit
MPLAIEIITPRGAALKREGLRKIVLRRREERFELGSEIAILPHHGEMMVRVPECDISMIDEEGVARVHVTGGFAEVYNGVVTLLTAEASAPTTSAEACPTPPEG